jgi:hypothetical protein
VAGLLVVQVQPAFGADRPTGDQQPGVLGDHRVGVDDTKVHPGNPSTPRMQLWKAATAVTQTPTADQHETWNREQGRRSRLRH